VLQVWLSDLMAFIAVASGSTGETEKLGDATNILSVALQNSLSPIDMAIRGWYALVGALHAGQAGIQAVIADLSQLLEMLAKSGAAKFVLGGELAKEIELTSKEFKNTFRSGSLELLAKSGKDFNFAFGDATTKMLDKQKQAMMKLREEVNAPMKKITDFGEKSKLKEKAKKKKEESVRLASPETLEKTSTAAYVQFMKNDREVNNRFNKMLIDSSAQQSAALRSIDERLKRAPIAVGLAGHV